MSYVVLARKYRPPDFGALVGQEHVVQALANALTQQRLHHAYLFTGTRGVGKTTISRILAKSLNCTGPDGSGGITAHPCGVCQACRDIDIGRFIDYVELDAASNRGVDEISQLLDQSVYKPVVGRFKVYMVDEVHMLSTTAFNAMLKTLEEPPEYLKFVLATTDPQKVPATVLSRCLQFNLRPMAPQTVQQHLADVLRRESIDAEPGALRLLSRAARGSMRDALSLADQAIAFGAGSLQEEGVRQMLGAVDRGHAVRMVEALAAGDGLRLVGAADALRALGLSAGGALEELAALLQQMAVLQAVPAAADPTDPEAPEALRLASLLAADELQLFYSIALQGRAELGLAPDEYSGLVMVLLRMLAFKPPAADDLPRLPSNGAGAGAGAGAGTVAAGATGAVIGAVASRLTGPVASAVTRAGAASAAPPAAERPLPQAAEAVERPIPPSPSPPSPSPSPSPSPVPVPVPPSLPPPLSPPRPPPPSQPPQRAAAAAVAAAPVLRVQPVPRPPADEPPPWLDVPDADEDGTAWGNADGERQAAPSRPAAPARPEAAPFVAQEAGSDLPRPRPGRPATAGAPAPRAAAPAPAPLSPPLTPLEPTPLGDRWVEQARQMIDSGSIGAMVRELAMQSQCVALDLAAEPAVCRLRVEREMLRAPATVEKLQVALSALLGRDIRIETEVGLAADSPARREAAERERRQGEAEQIIQHDPLVQALMAQYKTARIVPGSVKPN